MNLRLRCVTVNAPLAYRRPSAECACPCLHWCHCQCVPGSCLLQNNLLCKTGIVWFLQNHYIVPWVVYRRNFQGLQMDNNKVTAVMSKPKTNSVNQQQIFQRFANFYLWLVLWQQNLLKARIQACILSRLDRKNISSSKRSIPLLKYPDQNDGFLK